MSRDLSGGLGAITLQEWKDLAEMDFELRPDATNAGCYRSALTPGLLLSYRAGSVVATGDLGEEALAQVEGLARLLRASLVGADGREVVSARTAARSSAPVGVARLVPVPQPTSASTNPFSIGSTKASKAKAVPLPPSVAPGVIVPRAARATRTSPSSASNVSNPSSPSSPSSPSNVSSASSPSNVSSASGTPEANRTVGFLLALVWNFLVYVVSLGSTAVLLLVSTTLVGAISGLTSIAGTSEYPGSMSGYPGATPDLESLDLPLAAILIPMLLACLVYCLLVRLAVRSMFDPGHRAGPGAAAVLLPLALFLVFLALRYNSVVDDLVYGTSSSSTLLNRLAHVVIAVTPTLVWWGRDRTTGRYARRSEEA